MPKKQMYDLICVGAGPGGTAAAKIGADLGLDVLLVERAEVPGQKNMSGAVLFTPICTEIFPNFMSAPFMKEATTLSQLSMRITLDNDEHEITVGMSPGSDCMTGMPVISRPETDAWMANEAVKAGAEPLYSTRVDDVIIDKTAEGGPRVIGIITDKGEKIYAHAVADCSGVDSIIAKKSGLIPHHHWKKEMIAIKLVYELPKEEIWKRFDFWWGKDGRPSCDWGVVPAYFGMNPNHWAAHLVGCPGSGHMEATVYMSMQEMVETRQNIWQRMDWFLQTGDRFLEGAELVRVNFHPLNCFDLVGYEALSSYMPGLALVGDAGSFANPVESWGANVAQWQGRMFAQLVAGMKRDNDWSKERFAEYETNWRNSWVGDDMHLVPMNTMFRNGQFETLMKAVDAAVVRAVDGKIKCQSYSQLMPAAVGALLPYLTEFVPTPPFKDAAKRAAKKIQPLMALAAQLKD